MPDRSGFSVSVWHSHARLPDRKSTRLNSSHGYISYAVFCLNTKNPGSPNGIKGGEELASSLNQLGSRPDFFSVPGLLAFVTPNGQVVPGSSVPTDRSARLQL